MSVSLRSAFRGAVDEGHRRLTRSLPSLLATGAVGGIDLGVGVFALLVVQHRTGDPLLGALAFSIGFIALILARSELFTENFLVPIVAVATGRESWGKVLRLWGGTAAMNLAGGLVVATVIVQARPDVADTAVELASHAQSLGVGVESFFAAVMGGVIITLMTWMERSSPALGGKLVAAIVTGFLLVYSEVLHSIVASLEQFVALQFGAPFGYLDWFGQFWWMVLGNAVGGIGLVTVLRLVQVGPEQLREEQRYSEERPDEAPPPDEDAQEDEARERSRRGASTG